MNWTALAAYWRDRALRAEQLAGRTSPPEPPGLVGFDLVVYWRGRALAASE
jgi:hypothetical protein